MNKQKLLTVLLICGLLFWIAYLVFHLSDNLTDVNFKFKELGNQLHSDEVNENTQIVEDVLVLIQKHYVDEVKLREIVYPAIKEMLNQLDPHSHFFTPEECEKMMEREKNIQEYTGIGAIIGFRQDWQALRDQIKSNNFDINQASIEIKKPFDNSPAQKAGLLPRDEIVTVDGALVKEIGAAEIAKVSQVELKIAMKLEKVVDKILGPAGTPVRLSVKRKGWTGVRNFDIFRQIIQIKNVEWKIISSHNKKIGYLQIYSFMPLTTAKNVKEAVKKFKDSGVNGIILDLRNNSGGLLGACIGVLKNFLPPNSLVISTKSKTKEDELYTGSFYFSYFSLPLVVLINDLSASASEIVAGALRDHKRAILLGEKTYGKGSIQKTWDFADGSALWLTIGRYFLPDGESIHEKGILPHIEIEADFDEPIIPTALEVLLNWESYKEKFLK